LSNDDVSSLGALSAVSVLLLHVVSAWHVVAAAPQEEELGYVAAAASGKGGGGGALDNVMLK
jgi:hypothetical protein